MVVVLRMNRSWMKWMRAQFPDVAKRTVIPSTAGDDSDDGDDDDDGDSAWM